MLKGFMRKIYMNNPFNLQSKIDLFEIRNVKNIK